MNAIPPACRPTATPRRASSLVALTALQLLACYKETVYIPPELAPAPRLPVKGSHGWSPGQHLRFGEYETERRESQLKQAVIGAVANLLRGEGIEPLGFRLNASGRDRWRADCDPVTRHRDGEPVSEPNDLRCTLVLEAGDSSRTWRLSVSKPLNRVPLGDLNGPGGRLVVMGTTRDAKGRVQPGDRAFGYHVLNGTQAVAAVEFFDAAVWLHPELAPERRDLLAATAAALLLWDYLVRTPL